MSWWTLFQVTSILQLFDPLKEVEFAKSAREKDPTAADPTFVLRQQQLSLINIIIAQGNEFRNPQEL
jgi:hypothetical protein